MGRRKTTGGGLTIDDRTATIKDFVPSTMEDLEEYARLGREADEARRSRRAARKSGATIDEAQDDVATDHTTTTEGEVDMSKTKTKTKGGAAAKPATKAATKAPAKKAATKAPVKAPAKAATKAPVKKAPAKKAVTNDKRRDARSTRGIGALAIELIKRGLGTEDVIKGVKTQFPDSKVNDRHVAWYRNKMKRDAEA